MTCNGKERRGGRRGAASPPIRVKNISPTGRQEAAFASGLSYELIRRSELRRAERAEGQK